MNDPRALGTGHAVRAGEARHNPVQVFKKLETKVFDGSHNSAMNTILNVMVALAMAFDELLNDTGIDPDYFCPRPQENVAIVCLDSKN